MRLLPSRIHVHIGNSVSHPESKTGNFYIRGRNSLFHPFCYIDSRYTGRVWSACSDKGYQASTQTSGSSTLFSFVAFIIASWGWARVRVMKHAYKTPKVVVIGLPIDRTVLQTISNPGIGGPEEIIIE